MTKQENPAPPPYPYPFEYFMPPGEMDLQESESSMHLSDYYYMLLKHKWLIVVSILVCLGLAILYNAWVRPVYRTQSTLALNTDQIRAPLTGETLVYQSDISQVMAFNTHMSLITSRPVLEQVIRKLKLDRIDRLQSMETRPLRQMVNQFKDNIFMLLGKSEPESLPPPDIDSLVGMLQNKISTSEVRDTLLMRINVEDHDPATAQEIANTLAREYIQFDISNRLKSSQNTVSWMSDQLYEMKKKLEDAEAEFQAFKQNEQIFSLEGRQGQISQNINDSNNAYMQTKNKRLELDVKLKELNRISRTWGNARNVRALLDNSLITDLNRQLVDGEVELSRMKKVYKSKHPKMIQLTTRIDKIRNQIKDELDKEVTNLRAQRELLLVKENSLQKSITEFEGEAMNINSKELKYNILERNVETYRQLYDKLLTKVKQPTIMDSGESSNLYVAEAAVIPKWPVRPKKRRTILLGLMLGLMAGVGMSFLWEYLDRSIRTEEDVQRHLDLPVLSVIPKAEKAKQKVYYGN